MIKLFVVLRKNIEYIIILLILCYFCLYLVNPKFSFEDDEAGVVEAYCAMRLIDNMAQKLTFPITGYPVFKIFGKEIPLMLSEYVGTVEFFFNFTCPLSYKGSDDCYAYKCYFDSIYWSDFSL